MASERMRGRATGSSPFEGLYGFSRAVRVGNRIMVSGTAPVEADGSSTPGDAAERRGVVRRRNREAGMSAAPTTTDVVAVTDRG